MSYEPNIRKRPTDFLLPLYQQMIQKSGREPADIGSTPASKISLADMNTEFDRMSAERELKSYGFESAKKHREESLDLQKSALAFRKDYGDRVRTFQSEQSEKATNIAKWGLGVSAGNMLTNWLRGIQESRMTAKQASAYDAILEALRRRA